jgi:hypothetical protein
MAEAQAVNRVHRIGQTKDVHITRYCVNNSIEEVSSSSYPGVRVKFYRLADVAFAVPISLSSPWLPQYIC